MRARTALSQIGRSARGRGRPLELSLLFVAHHLGAQATTTRLNKQFIVTGVRDFNTPLSLDAKKK